MNISHSDNPDRFLQAVLEGFVDGILVLTEQQTVIYANATAHSICVQLLQGATDPLPKEITRVCQALIDSRELYPERSITIESEATTSETTIRIRGQWLNLEDTQGSCLLLRLQNESQSIQALAIAEAQTWGLTPRETEVWLLRRSGCSRKAIAADLYIALDTVKKHLKNIHFKQQAAIDEDVWRSSQVHDLAS